MPLLPDPPLRAHPRVHWHRAALHHRANERIVSLVPSLSESLFLLGLGERLVGVTEYCVHPAGAFEGLPRLGGTKDAAVEAIISLAPDLVIANQEENTARVVRQLADHGIDVWVTYPRTVEEGVLLLEDLATLGASEAAVREQIRPVRREFDRAHALRATRREQAGESTRAALGPSVFCPIWRDPWMTVGADTYIHDLLELCGAKNCFAAALDAREVELDGELAANRGAREPEDRRYPIVDLDALVRAQPEVILLPDEPYAFSEADAVFLGELDVPAAREGRIHLIDGTLVSWYGPRIAESIQVLARLFANN